jgi:hypothetical protein
MKKILKFLTILLAATSIGCASGNFSPRNDPNIENQNGKIDEIRNNQNGVMAEIGKLKQSAEFQNSKLQEVQNGMLNLNTAISRNENSGVQILQGDGSLMFIFSICVIGMLLHYRNRAVKNEKAAEIMAREIVRFNDVTLNDNVLRAAMHSPSELHVYNMMLKQQKQLKK